MGIKGNRFLTESLCASKPGINRWPLPHGSDCHQQATYPVPSPPERIASQLFKLPGPFRAFLLRQDTASFSSLSYHEATELTITDVVVDALAIRAEGWMRIVSSP